MIEDAVESIDVRSERSNMRLVGHCGMGGAGDGMHINLKDGYAFFGHMGNQGTSIIDVRDPYHPVVVGQIAAPANTHSHKVQIVDDLMVVNRERLPVPHGGSLTQPWVSGISVYDVSTPTDPKEIGFWPCGGRGVHRMTYWQHPYAFCATGAPNYRAEFLTVVDLSDPTRPHEVGRWWMPGQRIDETIEWPDDKIVKLHHGLPRGNRLYCGWWDYGLVILDTTDVTRPAMISRLPFPAAESKNTHTALPLPGRDIVVVTDECNVDDSDFEYGVRVVDISDERNPVLTAKFPVPEVRSRGLRFGPHNLHEMRPGTYQDANKVFLTYFSGGVRVVDVSDPYRPVEIAHHVPAAPPNQRSIQLNDIIVDESGLVYVSDRYTGGLYIFELT